MVGDVTLDRGSNMLFSVAIIYWTGEYRAIIVTN